MAKTSKTLFEQLREEAEATAPERSISTSPYLRWAIIIVGFATLSILLPGTSGQLDKQAYDRTLLGITWSVEDIVAAYSFPVVKDEAQLNSEQEAAVAKAPLVLRLNSADPGDRLHAFRTGFSSIGQSVQSEWKPLAGTIESFLTQPLMHDLRGAGAEREVAIVRRPDGSEYLTSLKNILGRTATLSKVMGAASEMSSDSRTKLQALLDSTFTPTLELDSVATQEIRQEVMRSVATTSEIVRKGDIVVAKGQRVDARTLRRLTAYRSAQFVRSSDPFSSFVALGSLAHAVIIMAFVVLYLALLRPISFERNGQLGFLIALPVLTGLLGWVSVHVHSIFPIEYIIIVPALSMIVTVLFEERTALVTTLAMALSVGAARGDDYGIALVLLTGGTFGIYSSRNVQSRTQIFTSIVAVAIGLIVATLAIDLQRGSPIAFIWPKVLMATANGVLSPLVTVAVIIAFERVFNVATDMRLEDFDDLNHKLLLQLHERAPGTYQHTLAVARLSESAAAAIGANPLLARVGAYFHDVGKIEKSEYFVENQVAIDNKHDRLSPKKSAAIIRQHVQDGVELAKQYGIPDRIAKFIPMHHGTILIRHFYAKALDESLLKDMVVDESDFRYPGPRPDSKETAVVMIADAVEALSRLVDTGQRDDIDAAVQSIILDRVTDGQLNESSLTLNDLEVIRETFVKNLLGTTHQRIAYKGKTEATDEASV